MLVYTDFRGNFTKYPLESETVCFMKPNISVYKSNSHMKPSSV